MSDFPLRCENCSDELKANRAFHFDGFFYCLHCTPIDRIGETVRSYLDEDNLADALTVLKALVADGQEKLDRMRELRIIAAKRRLQTAIRTVERK